MMDISIVIVNYNVCYFLRQTLLSVRAGISSLEVEIFVVDNASVDASTSMVEREFPEVKLIKSKENLGFSKANNLAIQRARGKYILLLNPDTILSDDTLTKCYHFMEQQEGIGALGPRMIDGAGYFLPESKRGFPSPSVAFYKAFGLSKVFRSSSFFNRYHMGHLPEGKSASIDVLAGAFMFIRHSVLEHVGYLDERFFMYGEDIDLSYRIKQAGYENYYFPETSIIHFKGESTKKGSLNYVKVFYQAMILFADKHFKGQKAKSFISLMKTGIGLRAFLDILKGISYKMLLPLFDFILIFLGLFVFKEFWEVYYFDNPTHFDGTYIYYHMLIYTLVWMTGTYIFGGYQRRYKMVGVLQGILIVSLIQFAIYGMLNPHYRPSRMMLVMGTIWALIVVLFNRLLPHFIQYGNLDLGQDQKKRIVLIGSQEETDRIAQILQKLRSDHVVLAQVNYIQQNKDAWTIRLKKLMQAFKVDEVIWALKDVPYTVMIQYMSTEGQGMSHKMIDGASEVILGSQSKNDRGEVYAGREHYALSDTVTIRLKRILDLTIALFFLILSPVLFLCRGNRLNFLINLGKVFGGYTWIGYYEVNHPSKTLPKLPKSILPPVYRLIELDTSLMFKANVEYAKGYTPLKDLGFLIRQICHLGIRNATSMNTIEYKSAEEEE